jgi:hypothetical protein
MAVRRTWWVKLRRADKHFGDFKCEFERLRDGDYPYRVSTEIKSHGKVDYLIVRGYLPAPTDAFDDIAAIVGDLIANARSAMDHVCVALTGNEKAQFPIFVENIWQPDPDPRTGKNRNKGRRDSFSKDTKGMPAAALALVKRLQPHMTIPQRPEDDPLAILNRISNADKHRTLMVTSRYVYNDRATVMLPGWPVPQLISEPRRKRMDGAILGTLPVSWPPDATPEVKASGGIEIGLKEAPSLNWDWEVPITLENILKYVGSAVVAPLDAHVT